MDRVRRPGAPWPSRVLRRQRARERRLSTPSVHREQRPARSLAFARDHVWSFDATARSWSGSQRAVGHLCWEDSSDHDRCEPGVTRDHRWSRGLICGYLVAYARRDGLSRMVVHFVGCGGLAVRAGRRDRRASTKARRARRGAGGAGLSGLGSLWARMEGWRRLMREVGSRCSAANRRGLTGGTLAARESLGGARDMAGP